MILSLDEKSPRREVTLEVFDQKAPWILPKLQGCVAFGVSRTGPYACVQFICGDTLYKIGLPMEIWRAIAEEVNHT